jgi:4-diphosphocytidyl-2-C-methyl-D-erythritol kinase
VDLNLKGKYLVLVNPQIHISTQEAYAGVIPKAPEEDLKTILSNPDLWKDQLVNDFEASIFPKYPEIAAIKDQLYDLGASYAAMSGSGATVFGLFDSKPGNATWRESYFVFEKEM